MALEQFTPEPGDPIPNNSRLPVLIWRDALGPAGRSPDPEEVAARFAFNGWPARWRGGVFDYDHYHTTAHEALGCVSGHATLRIGGPQGRDVILRAGDALALPAGTGHRRIEASGDFLVVGAYPDGQDWDIRRDAPDAATLERIAAVPAPPRDPLEGGSGATTRLWR